MKVVVTGAKGGIGSAVCTGLGWRGHQVFEVDPRGRFHTPVSETLARLAPVTYDAWVNCAGALVGAMEANYDLSVGILCTAQRAGARIAINLSGAGVGGQPAYELPGEYVASKAAVVAYTEWFAHKYPDFCAHVLAPGRIATKLTGYKGDSPDKAVEVMLWLLAEPRRSLSGRLIAIRDGLREIEREWRFPTYSDIWQLRRVVP